MSGHVVVTVCKVGDVLFFYFLVSDERPKIKMSLKQLIIFLRRVISLMIQSHDLEQEYESGTSEDMNLTARQDNDL